MRFDTFAIRNYAIEKHGDQKYGERPYIYHLDMVYEESLSHGLPPVVSVASFLHDVLEDTDTCYAEIEQEFESKELADLIECVTDEPGKNRKERKAATYSKIKANRDAVALKLCDRIANVRSCLIDKNTSLLSMYQKEQAEFEAQLKEKDEYPSLWAELDRLIKE